MRQKWKRSCGRPLPEVRDPTRDADKLESVCNPSLWTSSRQNIELCLALQLLSSPVWTLYIPTRYVAASILGTHFSTNPVKPPFNKSPVHYCPLNKTQWNNNHIAASMNARNCDELKIFWDKGKKLKHGYFNINRETLQRTQIVQCGKSASVWLKTSVKDLNAIRLCNRKFTSTNATSYCARNFRSLHLEVLNYIC